MIDHLFILVASSKKSLCVCEQRNYHVVWFPFCQRKKKKVKRVSFDCWINSHPYTLLRFCMQQLWLLFVGGIFFLGLPKTLFLVIVHDSPCPFYPHILFFNPQLKQSLSLLRIVCPILSSLSSFTHNVSTL